MADFLIKHFEANHDIVQTLLLASVVGLGFITLCLMGLIFRIVWKSFSSYKVRVDTLLDSSEKYQSRVVGQLEDILECQHNHSSLLSSFSESMADQREHNAKVNGELDVLHTKITHIHEAHDDLKKSLELNTRVTNDIHNRVNLLENSAPVKWGRGDAR